MKKFKSVVGIICFANSIFCSAEGYASGMITDLSILSSDAYQSSSTSSSPPTATVKVSGNVTDQVCAFAGLSLPDITDQFQKLAYGTLLTAQVNGRAVDITYKLETTGCRVTTVKLSQS